MTSPAALTVTETDLDTIEACTATVAVMVGPDGTLARPPAA